MHLNWKPNLSASALHSAEACSKFPDRVTDPQVASNVGPYGKRLGEWIARMSFPDVERFWDDLIAMGSQIDSNSELAISVLRKRAGTSVAEAHSASLAGLITDIEAAFLQMFPKYMEQSALRIRPLQDQWLGYGQGLLAHLKRLTEKDLFVDECQVVGIQPILGGYGKAHLDQNLVRIEAILTNPMSELPEVVRLAWLVSQLNLDLPGFNEHLGFGVARRLAPLAMLPPALAAAEVLELAKCDEATASLAIEQWQIAVPGSVDLESELAPSLMDWWETYLQTRPEWSTALRALAKMLGV
jgi:hypothetical protein